MGGDLCWLLKKRQRKFVPAGEELLVRLARGVCEDEIKLD
jgi:hypothetical protein